MSRRAQLYFLHLFPITECFLLASHITVVNLNPTFLNCVCHTDYAARRGFQLFSPGFSPESLRPYEVLYHDILLLY